MARLNRTIIGLKEVYLATGKKIAIEFESHYYRIERVHESTAGGIYLEFESHYYRIESYRGFGYRRIRHG